MDADWYVEYSKTADDGKEIAYSPMSSYINQPVGTEFYHTFVQDIINSL